MKYFIITYNGNLINYKWKMHVMPNYFFITFSLPCTFQLYINCIISVSCKTVNAEKIYKFLWLESIMTENKLTKQIKIKMTINNYLNDNNKYKD